MLNRYLDIYDMIEDPEADNNIEDDKFKCTDIPAFTDLRLPNKNMINEVQRDKLRDWCLKMSIEKSDEVNLPTHHCPDCGKAVFIVKNFKNLEKI